ncbi:MAG: ABC transporter ATP-binding protein [Bacillota bacterium]|nr:ABC transporter ATP-binding protein [Bacillota bacterium]
MSSIILEAKSVTRTFGGLKAIDNVDIKVEEGSIRGLIGPNGAGKTTLFNIITGIYKPTAGKILFENKEISNIKPHKIASMGISRTFQNLQLFNDMTVIDNIAIAQNMNYPIRVWDSLFRNKNFKKIENSIYQKSNEILEFIGLQDRKNDYPGNLSYGGQRLLEIGRALATEPRIILLDEPAAGMNTLEIDELMKMIIKVRELGITIVLIEHNMKFAMMLSDYITVLDSGKIIAEGIPKEIQSNIEVIKAYLGTKKNGTPKVIEKEEHNIANNS